MRESAGQIALAHAGQPGGQHVELLRDPAEGARRGRGAAIEAAGDLGIERFHSSGLVGGSLGISRIFRTDNLDFDTRPSCQRTKGGDHALGLSRHIVPLKEVVGMRRNAMPASLGIRITKVPQRVDAGQRASCGTVLSLTPDDSANGIPMNDTGHKTDSSAQLDPQPLGLDTILPISPADLEACIAPVYQSAVREMPRGELLALLCAQLARRIDAPLVTIVRKLGTGAFALEAASSEDTLWLEFQHIQERWDGGIASLGPAGRALHCRAPVRLSFGHEDLAMWRWAAESQGIHEVVALPIALPRDDYVLEIFAASPRRGGAHDATIGHLSDALTKLLSDLEKLDLQRLLKRALEAAENSSFITDAHGTIVWSNDAFSDLTGHAAADVRGKNPSLLQSGHQTLRYYRELWSTIRSGNVWRGETVDRNKAGALYTIHQTVTPIINDGRITHYVSIQQDIGRQRRQQNALELAAGTDHRTGLLTPAAFEQAAREILTSADAADRGVELVLVSLRGMGRSSSGFEAERDEFLSAAMGTRAREVIPSAHLVTSIGPYEYAVLLHLDLLAGVAVSELVEGLRRRLGDPVLYLGDSLSADVHCGRARYPGDGQIFKALMDHADRQLADEPIARAGRPLAG